MKKIGLIASAVVLAVSALGVISPKAYAAGQTCTWTGAGSDTKFSTAENWTNCSSAAPTNGDVLKFTQLASDSSSQSHTVDIDIIGVKFAGITVDAATPTASVTSTLSFQGSSLELIGGATLTATNANNGTYGVALKNLPLHTYGDLDFGDGFSSVSTAGFGTVDGDVTLHGYNTQYYFSGTVTGKLIVADGSTTIDPSRSTIGSIEIGQGATLAFRAAGSNTDLDALTNITISSPIALNGGSISFAISQVYDTSWSSKPTTYTISGAVSLTTDATISAETNVTVNLNGVLNKNNHTLIIANYNQGSLLIAGKEYRNDPKTTDLSDSKPACDTGDQSGCYAVVDNETATLSGTRGDMTVYKGGTLKGKGTITGLLYVNSGGAVAPGNSPGCLTSDTLSLSGEYQFELGGADPCTGYDQLIVKNASNSSMAVDFGAGTATLTTSRYNNYTPKQGQVFVIIDQAGTAAVNGTFKDLPEGATFTQNGVVFKISYVGGDGNDVTLTVQNQPTAPDTGVEILRANPALIAGATLMGVIVMLGLARFSAKRR